jgi:hypothetical protein
MHSGSNRIFGGEGDIVVAKYVNGDVVAYCPECEALTTFEHRTQGQEYQTILVEKIHMYNGIRYTRIHYRLVRCASCKRGGLAVIHDIGKVVEGVLSEFYPISVDNLTLPPNAPKDIVAEFREAELCAAVAANRASSALFRSVLEKTLKANGYVQGTLAGKIDEAAHDHVLTESRRKRAHNEIRVLGNDVLHDDWREVSSEDVQGARHYAQRILEDFYDDRASVLSILIQAGRIPQAKDNNSN